jgi:hypothetical protein
LSIATTGFTSQPSRCSNCFPMSLVRARDALTALLAGGLPSSALPVCNCTRQRGSLCRGRRASRITPSFHGARAWDAEEGCAGSAQRRRSGPTPHPVSSSSAMGVSLGSSDAAAPPLGRARGRAVVNHEGRHRSALAATLGRPSTAEIWI